MYNIRTWDYIEHAASLGGEEKMVELIRHIKSSEISKRIHGTWDVVKLVLSVYDNDPMQLYKEALHITFDSTTDSWIFEYYAVPYKKLEFEREYQADKGIEKFESFVKMIRW